MLVAALMLASCSAAATRPQTVGPSTTSSVSAPYEDTQPDGLPALPGSWNGGKGAVTTTTRDPPVVVAPVTTTTAPALLANVNYWRSQADQEDGVVARAQTLVNQDQGTADESDDARMLERDEAAEDQDQRNLQQAEARYQVAQTG